MKQTCILIVPALDAEQNIESVKEYVKNFIGLRHLCDEQPDDNAPLVMVNSLISKEDKTRLAKKLNATNVALCFIEGEETVFDGDTKEYIDVTLRP